MLRGDILKDDSGDYAVFTEQGASASHMTENNVLDITSRLPEHSGQASDALSAHSPVKMKDAPELLQLSEDCPKIWIMFPKARRPQNWDSLDNPVVPLELKYLRSSIGLTPMGDKVLRNFCLKKDGEKKAPDGSACTLIEKCNYSCQCMLTPQKMARETQSMPNMWAHLQKQIDLEDPASLRKSWMY